MGKMQGVAEAPVIDARCIQQKIEYRHRVFFVAQFAAPSVAFVLGQKT
jgi:hypothetical protein